MAIKYVPYFPNTLEGQAILDNFVRTKRVLRYRDNDQVIDRIQRGMPLYEMELKEQIGKNPDRNMVIRGECLSACAYMRDKGIFVDLIYVDPPFASGADYAKKVYGRRNPKVAEAIHEAEGELDIDELRAFEEKMYGDIWDKERPRLSSYSVLNEEFRTWLETHACEYGFIQRYPTNKLLRTGWDEPWHYRYVGIEVANFIKNSGMCYEEFFKHYNPEFKE